MRIGGIDPGVTGACALAEFDSGRILSPWHVIDMPVIGDTRPELNPGALKAWLMEVRPDLVFVELVNAMPSIPDKDGSRRSMGSASAFRFGSMSGGIKATLACCEIPYLMITPQSWKAYYNLRGSDKERSRRVASELFPAALCLLARKKDQARAEAMLIAAAGYCLREAKARKPLVRKADSRACREPSNKDLFEAKA